MLATSNPPGTPLIMSAGAASGSMLVRVLSDNPPNDVMSAWNFNLTILPDSGATGTLTFHAPASGTPPNPADYIFGDSGLGIAVINSGVQLSANDFFDPSIGLGAAVPGTPAANLLQMEFQASSNASGLFGIYVLEGSALTQWTDGDGTNQYFMNVPDGSGMVRIGEVRIQQAVPEPSSLILLVLSGAVLGGWKIRCCCLHVKS